MALCGAVAVVLPTLGCRQDMHDQPRYKPLAASRLFADGKSARLPVGGTVPFAAATADVSSAAGPDRQPIERASPPLSAALLARGQERFEIFCAPCHGTLGDGQGMVVKRGFRQPPTYHSDRLRQAPLEHFVDVMTRGFGVMYSYASRLAPEDRLAVAAHVRVLQLSQHARLEDVPQSERAALEREAP
ncbi:MAG: cytochrome c [Deltaproteobacteria bacterium]|nr:cytochrome c [Deltaproteobacteria bacterium]